MQQIAQSAQIGKDVQIGSFTVIGDNVRIGDGCRIGHHVVIHEGTVLGSHVRVDDFTVIGKLPMRAVTSIFKEGHPLEPASIGDGSLIGTSVVIYRGCTVGSKVLVADLATLRENVKIGDLTIIGRGAAVENYCSVGKRCKIETNAYITAYSLLEDYVFVAPGVVTSNDHYAGRTRERFKRFKGVTVKKGGRIGAQATILPGKTIEEDGFVGAGSVVTADVESRTVYTGSPARARKPVPSEQWLENQDYYDEGQRREKNSGE